MLKRIKEEFYINLGHWVPQNTGYPRNPRIYVVIQSQWNGHSCPVPFSAQCFTRNKYERLGSHFQQKKDQETELLFFPKEEYFVFSSSFLLRLCCLLFCVCLFVSGIESTPPWNKESNKCGNFCPFAKKCRNQFGAFRWEKFNLFWDRSKHHLVKSLYRLEIAMPAK